MEKQKEKKDAIILCFADVCAEKRMLFWQIVLDLDETLICAYESTSLPPGVRNQATEAGLNWFELECVSSDKVSFSFHSCFSFY